MEQQRFTHENSLSLKCMQELVTIAEENFFQYVYLIDHTKNHQDDSYKFG